MILEYLLVKIKKKIIWVYFIDFFCNFFCFIKKDFILFLFFFLNSFEKNDNNIKDEFSKFFFIQYFVTAFPVIIGNAVTKYFNQQIKQKVHFYRKFLHSYFLFIDLGSI